MNIVLNKLLPQLPHGSTIHLELHNNRGDHILIWLFQMWGWEIGNLSCSSLFSLDFGNWCSDNLSSSLY